MHITMASVHKPKSHDAPDRRHAPDVTPPDATAEPPPAPESNTVVAQPPAQPAATTQTKTETATKPTAETPAVPKAPAAPAPEPVQAGE
jgi:hypothetical protein